MPEQYRFLNKEINKLKDKLSKSEVITFDDIEILEKDIKTLYQESEEEIIRLEENLKDSESEIKNLESTIEDLESDLKFAQQKEL